MALELQVRAAGWGCGLADRTNGAAANARADGARRKRPAPADWRIDRSSSQSSSACGERGDIVKTMHRELAAAGLSRAAGNFIDLRSGTRAVRRLVGRVVGEGLSDELTGAAMSSIDGIDGRTHYAEIGNLSGQRGTARPEHDCGAQLTRCRAARRSIEPSRRSPPRHDGRYSDRLHRQFDPQASGEYVASHVRRLEAMRQEGMVEPSCRRKLGSGRRLPGSSASVRELANAPAIRCGLPCLSWQRLEDLPQAVGRDLA